MDKRGKAAISLLLVLLLALGTALAGLPPLVLTAQAADGSHEHDEACGYVEGTEEIPCDMDCGEIHKEGCAYTPAVEAVPCGHVHDGDCGYVEAAEAIPCNMDCGETHREDCAYAPGVEAVPCGHEHDGACGYAEGAEEIPCDMACVETHKESCAYTPAVESVPCGYVPDDAPAPDTPAEITVAALDPLEESVLFQEYELGEITSQAELTLPDALTGTDADGNPLSIKGVTWACGIFDAETEGSYIFLPALPEGYKLAEGLTLPEIAVTLNPLAVARLMSGGSMITCMVRCESFEVTGHPVSLWQNGVLLLTATTDEFGFCQFDDIADGEYQVAVDANLYQGIMYSDEVQTVTVNGGNANCTFVLRPSYGDYFTDGVFKYRILSHVNKQVELVKPSGGVPSPLNIPANVTHEGTNYAVVRIGNDAFSGTGISGTLTIPSRVTSIGTSAFEGCTGISGMLTIPSSVTSIGDFAFSECTGISRLELPPAGSLVIGTYAFTSCTGLSGTLTIPFGVTSIGANAFSFCTGITALDLGDFSGPIGDSAFMWCSALAAITFGQATAPTLPTTVFQDVNATGTLYHPAESSGYNQVLAQLPPGWESSNFMPYHININPADGGTATTSPSLCRAGTDVTLTAHPAEGYAFVRWVTSPSNLSWVTGSSESHATATFTMQEGLHVTVTPVFSRSKFNLSGTVTAGAQPVSNPITVTLYHANGTYISSVATQGGAYSFPSLSPGDYKVTAMGVKVNNIPYYQTTLDVTVDAHDVTDANIALDSNTTSLTFVSAVADGVRYYATSTQIILTFSAPIALTLQDIQWGGTNDAAEMDGLVSKTGTDISQVWILKIKNVKHYENGQNGVGVKVNAPDGYFIRNIATRPVVLYIQIEPPSITAATYSTNTPLVGGEITVSPGTYTENEGGAAGEHRYAWYRAGTATGYGVRIADTQNYTPTGADFGRYIWVETTPVGTVGGVRGTAVASPRLRVGVKLTVTVTGAGGTSPTVDGAPAGAGVTVYEAATVSFTKNTAGDTVLWSASPAEGGFDDDTAVTAVYTPPAEPSAGTIALTATLTAEAHIHSYGTDWKSDANNHWHECACEDKAEVAAHIEDDGKVTTAPTESSAGIRTYSCTVCGRVLRTEEIPKLDPGHTHSYGTGWTYDANEHWHECSCGDRSDVAAHAEDDGKVTTAPTESSAGIRTYSCTVCGRVLRTEEIPKLDPGHTHSYGTGWTSDADEHWHECSCGDRADVAAHTEDGGKVTKQPTLTEPGVRTYSCTVCGRALRTEEIPKLGSGENNDGNDTNADTYTQRTLIDPDTGVSVTGSLAPGALVVIKEGVLHPAGACDVCDDLRVRSAAGELIVLYDISISGGYRGEVEVTIPVGSEYDGKRVTVIHCANKTAEEKTLTVANGNVTGTFGNLSPFAVLKPTATQEGDQNSTVDGLPGDANTPVQQTDDIGNGPRWWLWAIIPAAVLIIVVALAAWRRRKSRAK